MAHLLAALSSHYDANDFQIVAFEYTHDKMKARLQVAMFAKSHKLETRTLYWMDDNDNVEDAIESLIAKHIHTLIEDFIPENTEDEDLWSYRVSVFADVMESIVSNIRDKYPRGENRITDLV